MAQHEPLEFRLPADTDTVDFNSGTINPTAPVTFAEPSAGHEFG